MEILNINDLRITTPSVKVSVATPDGSGVLVHPSCLYFTNGWNGYRYWMVSTGYLASDLTKENPDLTVSNDGITFTALSGVSHPLVPYPGTGKYNSDPHLVLGPDNVMYLYYREYGVDYGEGSGFLEHIKVTYSSDGLTWSSATIVHSANQSVSRPCSPSVWYDHPTKTWYMLAVDIIPSPYVLKRYSSTTPTGIFSSETAVTVTNGWYSTLGPWHFEVTNLGDQLIALVQDGSNVGGALNLLVSIDSGLTWLRNTTALSGGGYYKSTMVVKQTNKGVAFDIFGAAFGLQSPAIRKATVTSDYANQVIQACNRISPYVIGDNFNRADSNTSLGMATSGQTWVNWGGTAGLSAGQAYLPSAGNTKMVIDSGLSDLRVSMETPIIDTQHWIIFRGQDTNNYWRFGHNSGYALQRIVAGSIVTPTLTANMGGVPRPGDRIGVVCSGSSIVCTANGLPMMECTDSTFQTNTFVGFQTSLTVPRFDNFMVSTL